jgi:hypothetical protein
VCLHLHEFKSFVVNDVLEQRVEKMLTPEQPNAASCFIRERARGHHGQHQTASPCFFRRTRVAIATVTQVDTSSEGSNTSLASFNHFEKGKGDAKNKVVNASEE